MPNNNPDTFPPEVIEKLENYVYRLIDPRNGDTFYVGRGKGNRVFDHIRGDLQQDELSEILSKIREIKLAGFEVAHVIHRHGMDESTASVVEAALIDAYPGLTNQMTGAGSGDFGVMHAKEIIDRYCAEEAVFRNKVLLITVNKSANERSLYDATRYAWRVDKKKAEEADVILAVRKGLIVGAFVAYEWLPATPENFPGIEENASGRYGFYGENASKEINLLIIFVK